MIGFELYIKDKVVSAALPKGNVNIIANRLIKEDVESTELFFSGLDSENNERIEWYKNCLEIGDEFTVKIINISTNSEPIRTEKISSSSIITEGKLRAYNKLKKELEDLGLI